MDITYQENYDILIQPYFPSKPASRNKLVDMINGQRIDGFITTPPCDADGFIADLMRTYKVPLVQINPIDRNNLTPFVAGDDYQGAYTATEYLISLGHQRIGFLMGPRNMRSSFDRLYGYRAALDTHQIVPEPAWIENSEFTFDGGYTAARLLMEKPVKPSAIFAGNDEAAYGALYALRELKVSVPGEMSVCGYDDLVMSKHIWPGLTTIHQTAEELVERATYMLFHLLKGEPVEHPNEIVSASLVIRGSTAAPP
jgi:LacI family transcriptional regulator